MKREIDIPSGNVQRFQLSGTLEEFATREACEAFRVNFVPDALPCDICVYVRRAVTQGELREADLWQRLQRLDNAK